MSEALETKKYRLLFIPVEDFVIFKSSIAKDKFNTYAPLNESKVENFHIGDSMTVYIPETHKNFMLKKAKKGEAL